MTIIGIRREWMYSGKSKVDASSFIVATKRKSPWARIFTPATSDSTYRRRSSSGASDAHDFSLMRLPSSRMATPPAIMALTMGLGGVLNRAFRPDDRRDDEVLGARVHRGLEDVRRATDGASRGVGQRRLADAGLADEPRIHGHVGRVDHHPRRLELQEELGTPYPLERQIVRLGELDLDVVDGDGLRHAEEQRTTAIHAARSTMAAAVGSGRRATRRTDATRSADRIVAATGRDILGASR